MTNLTRREFVKATAALSTAALISRTAYAAGTDSVRVGVIGCGGRGTGAAINSLESDPATQIVAMADVFKDRLNSSRAELTGADAALSKRVMVADNNCYTGFDAYKRLLDQGDVDIVILATCPHFRPIHLEAAVNAGKHIFTEKPVGVDPAGIRRVIAAAELAATKNLCIVAGTQRRHEAKYLALMDQIKKGAIGKITAAYAWWNQGGLWVHARKPEYSDMEWQIRNWLYFDWLSGDHIVEQHVHNLDVCNWAIGTHPVKALGIGGRQVRTGPEYGNIFDHFTVEYEYPDGVTMTSMCRQTDGCAQRVDEMVVGTEGVVKFGAGVIEGKNPFKFDASKSPNPYAVEHTDLVAAFRAGGGKSGYINEGKQVAESTLTAIMGRMSAYTGKEVTWDQALNSKLDLSPPSYAFGDHPFNPVPTPGRTQLL